MKCFVSGGAGFIGIHLVERLLSEENDVIVYDNLSAAAEDRLARFMTNPRFRFVLGDLLDADHLREAMRKADIVFHLAANSDIRAGEKNPDLEVQQGIIATFNVLQTMKQNSVRDIVFSSSSTVYGDAGGVELKEDFGPLIPISFYGASKLAAEGLICAFCHMSDMRSWIFRLANIVGKDLTHGVIFDFIRKLRENPRQLEILGNGNQTKPYLHVRECVEGMLEGLKRSHENVNIFNLSPPDAISVDRIASIVVEEMGLNNVALVHTGGEGGWKGDVPRVHLSNDKLKTLGWKPKMTSEEAVRTAVREVLSETERFR